MSKSVLAELGALALGESALVRGTRVVRCSLLGFRIGGDTLEAAEVAARLAGTAKGRTARVELCFRCGGDGLGRRDRGSCGVCHGRGILVVEPVEGWAGTTAAQRAAAVDQAVGALRGARQPRARDSLAELLTMLAPLAPSRAYGELRRGGVEPPAAARGVGG
jgi:hypothetical protein